MTSSATQDFLSEIASGRRIPEDKLAYFGASLCNLFHQAILFEFGKAEKSNGFTKAELARRIGRKPEQITRWLAYPGNLTLETVGEILVGMGLQVENLGLANLASGARARFPAPATEETRTPIEINEQKPTIVLPFKRVGHTPTTTAPPPMTPPTQYSIITPGARQNNGYKT